MRVIQMGLNYSTTRFQSLNAPSTAKFTWAKTRDVLENKTFDAFEERIEEDCSDLPHFPITTTYGLLLADEATSKILRPKLCENGGDIAECTIQTQFGTYTGFRAFNLLGQSPESNIFRLAESRDPTEIGVEQYISVSFAKWLKSTVNCGAIVFRDVETDGIYRPQQSLHPRSKDL